MEKPRKIISNSRFSVSIIILKLIEYLIFKAMFSCRRWYNFDYRLDAKIYIYIYIMQYGCIHVCVCVCVAFLDDNLADSKPVPDCGASFALCRAPKVPRLWNSFELSPDMERCQEGDGETSSMSSLVIKHIGLDDLVP